LRRHSATFAKTSLNRVAGPQHESILHATPGDFGTNAFSDEIGEGFALIEYGLRVAVNTDIDRH
jgi:hypothetical protein